MQQQMPDFTAFVNPQDLDASPLFHDPTWLARFEPDGLAQRPPKTQDSAVDLTTFSPTAFSPIKTEEAVVGTALFDTYSEPASNTPSPNDGFVFSTVNSPGDFLRDHSQTSSPETSDSWPAVALPLTCSIRLDKTKTRAETQIKTLVTLDPLPAHFQWLRFPRHTLSKSKQLAGDDEIQANEARDGTARLHLTLVLATAVETNEGLQRAYRRARADEATPRRPRGVPITEIDKDDPTHPQNGGAVVICEGCKEREAKRYNRKKKRNADEEDEWNRYEDERIIMINEKEFKRWQDVDTDADADGSCDAKKVDFAMRITCYCRHQEEKAPIGYRVIFTFTDTRDQLLAQQISDVIHITDDHKNRELPAEAIPGPLTIPPSHDTSSTAYTVPLCTYSPTFYAVYSQPTTPLLAQGPGLPHAQSAVWPQDAAATAAAFSMANCAFIPQMPQHQHQHQHQHQQPPQSQPHASGLAFGANTIPAQPAAAAMAQYNPHQRGGSYFTPTVLSQNIDPVPTRTSYSLHRPHSLDSFSQQWSLPYSPSTSLSQGFASQPPSRGPSRPPSPSWDQGRSNKKMRAVPGFMLHEDDEALTHG